MSASVACAPAADTAGETAEVSSRELRSEVLEWFASFQDAQARGDAAEISSYYALDSRFRWFEDGVLRYRSPAEIETALGQLSAMGPVETVYDEVEVLVTSPASALLHARFRTAIGGQGETGPVFSFAGVLSASLQKVSAPPGPEGEAEPAAEWKFLVGHSSTAREQSEERGGE